jgi:proteasome lid subunit RPN8/RPN11
VTLEITIARAVVRAMIAHARREAPRECCGLLIGRRGAIVRAWPARNVRPGVTRYKVHPQDHFNAIRAAREDGLDVIGAYHSHPAAPPVPSATDRGESVDPTLLHVIVSVAGTRARVRGYWLASDRVIEARLRRVRAAT